MKIRYFEQKIIENERIAQELGREMSGDSKCLNL